MKKHLPQYMAFVFVLCAAAPLACLGDGIPKTAWRRTLGQPLDHPGLRKNNVDIDEGYWQGAPVVGFGLEGVRQEPNEIGRRTQARNVSRARRANVWRADGQRQHQILVVTNFAVENNRLLPLFNLERTCNQVLHGATSSYTTWM